MNPHEALSPPRAAAEIPDSAERPGAFRARCIGGALIIAATAHAPAPQPARFVVHRIDAQGQVDTAPAMPLGPKSLTLADRDKARHGGAVRLLVEQYSF
ncbi:MAG: hypothetical protein AB7G15_12460 [Alphaproteobacteria bacterium]